MVIFKSISQPSMEEFDKLIAEARKQAKEAGLKHSDVHATDDKFLACAIASGSMIIISGDKHLHKVSVCQDIEILKPRAFINKISPTCNKYKC